MDQKSMNELEQISIIFFFYSRFKICLRVRNWQDTPKIVDGIIAAIITPILQQLLHRTLPGLQAKNRILRSVLRISPQLPGELPRRTSTYLPIICNLLVHASHTGKLQAAVGECPYQHLKQQQRQQQHLELLKL
ncbi:MAG: hypothetical protein MHMPM18_004794 [Marteilia pararefringens]